MQAAEAVAPQEEEGGEDAGMAEAEEAVDYGEAEMEATPEPKVNFCEAISNGFLVAPCT